MTPKLASKSLNSKDLSKWDILLFLIFNRFHNCYYTNPTS